jgi:hypothetical protein
MTEKKEYHAHSRLHGLVEDAMLRHRLHASPPDYFVSCSYGNMEARKVGVARLFLSSASMPEPSMSPRSTMQGTAQVSLTACPPTFFLLVFEERYQSRTVSRIYQPSVPGQAPLQIVEH